MLRKNPHDLLDALIFPLGEQNLRQILRNSKESGKYVVAHRRD